MLSMLLGFLFVAVDAFAILLLAGTWQHTRITGFLVVAASYALGILNRLLVPLVYRFVESADSGMAMQLSLVFQCLYLLIAALAVYGLWDIYRRLRAQPARTHAPAGGA